MAGAKYSPGFDDPSAHRKTTRTRTVVAGVVGVLALAALGLTFAAYLNPALSLEVASLMSYCAQVIGLR
ncbi:MAG: hypothetical protein AB7O55_35560 [Lautropia sp.]